MKRRKTIELSLLRKVADRTADTDELAAFEQWLQADARHRAYYERMGKFHAGQPAQPLDTDLTFAELKTQLGIGPHRRTYRLRTATAAAAAVALLAGLWFGAHSTDADAAMERVYEELAHEYAPGSDRARLTLDDGRCYELVQGESLRLDVEGGGRIENSADNRLVYTAGANPQAETDTQAATNRLTVPRGGSYSIQLEDGTTVHLNSESELVYPSVFAQQTRCVSLVGEAYFDVAHDADRPFVVEVDGYRIEVLGTQFNVTAYADERLCRSTLVEGSVRIIPDKEGETPHDEILLTPGQQAVRDTASDAFSVVCVDPERYTAWMRHEFVFDNTPLAEALRTVSRWYDFHYEITDPELEKYTVTGEISKDGGLDYLFRVLHEVHMPIRLRYENGILFVDKR